MNIEKKFDELMADLCQQMLDFPWADQQCYADWVAQTYYFVLHSTRLFASASSRCTLENNKLHFRYLDHLAEERGHEHLAKNDLKFMNFKAEDFPELPETSSLYQIQYYWIEHIHPTSFFGYLLCLEGLAVRIGKQIYEDAKEVHGDRATSFLRVHVEEDENHLEEGFKQTKDFSKAQLELVAQNLSQSANLYSNMLDHILSKSAGARLKQAA